MEINKGTKTYLSKHCNKCSKTISYKNWSRHLKTVKHQKNDVENTIPTKFHKQQRKTLKLKKQIIPKDHRVFHMLKKEKKSIHGAILFPKEKFVVFQHLKKVHLKLELKLILLKIIVVLKILKIF